MASTASRVRGQNAGLDLPPRTAGSLTPSPLPLSPATAGARDGNLPCARGTNPLAPHQRGEGGEHSEPGEGPEVLAPTLRPAQRGEGAKAPPHPALSPAPAGARGKYPPLAIPSPRASGERVASAASRVRGQRYWPRPAVPRQRVVLPPHPALSPALAGARDETRLSPALAGARDETRLSPALAGAREQARKCIDLRAG